MASVGVATVFLEIQEARCICTVALGPARSWTTVVPLDNGMMMPPRHFRERVQLTVGRPLLPGTGPPTAGEVSLVQIL